MAVPFVQGRLRDEALSVRVETECAYCRRRIHLEIDRELRHWVEEDGAEPVIFTLFVDFSKLRIPSIIDPF